MKVKLYTLLIIFITICLLSSIYFLRFTEIPVFHYEYIINSVEDYPETKDYFNKIIKNNKISYIESDRYNTLLNEIKKKKILNIIRDQNEF